VHYRWLASIDGIGMLSSLTPKRVCELVLSRCLCLVERLATVVIRDWDYDFTAKLNLLSREIITIITTALFRLLFGSEAKD